MPVYSTNFVNEYVEKRKAQIKHAQNLREQRKKQVNTKQECPRSSIKSSDKLSSTVSSVDERKTRYSQLQSFSDIQERDSLNTGTLTKETKRLPSMLCNNLSKTNSFQYSEHIGTALCAKNNNTNSSGNRNDCASKPPNISLINDPLEKYVSNEYQTNKIINSPDIKNPDEFIQISKKKLTNAIKEGIITANQMEQLWIMLLRSNKDNTPVSKDIDLYNPKDYQTGTCIDNTNAYTNNKSFNKVKSEKPLWDFDTDINYDYEKTPELKELSKQSKRKIEKVKQRVSSSQSVDNDNYSIQNLQINSKSKNLKSKDMNKLKSINNNVSQVKSNLSKLASNEFIESQLNVDIDEINLSSSVVSRPIDEIEDFEKTRKKLRKNCYRK